MNDFGELGKGMKCVNCGYEYFNKETLESDICPACGMSLTVTDKTYRPSASSVSWPKASMDVPDPALAVEAAVSSAINVRRIAIAVIIGVILAVGTLLVSVIDSILIVADDGVAGASLVTGAWVFLALAILIAGLYVIVFKKRLSRLERR